MTTVGLIGIALLCASPDAPLTLGANHELFLDDALIAASRNVVRRVHPAEKHPGNPLLRPTEPWEGAVTIVYGSVLREREKYRMWYYASGNVAYAESADGIAWVKPRLGLVRIGGEDTNLVVRGQPAGGEPATLPYFYEIFGVLRDDRDPDPQRRYKMGFLSIQRDYQGPREDPFHPRQRRGLGVAASADGLRWKLLDNWTTEAICDGATHWCWDAERAKYALYGRTKHVAPEVAEAWASDPWVRSHFWGRSVARVESPDFLHWDITEPAKAPVVMTADTKDQPGTEIYSMLVFPYESVYLGLVQVFHNRPEACHLDIELAVSRDGVRFTRVCQGEPFLPVGPVGAWDRFNNSLATNPPLIAGDWLRFYYGGRTARHSPYSGADSGEGFAGIGLAAIQRDRFVSLGASFDGGQIVTKPLRLGARRLHLNAKCDFGQIVVEVLGADGEPVARSKPVRADGLNLPVQWETGSLDGIDKPVTLRITLRNALLFSLWCS